MKLEELKRLADEATAAIGKGRTRCIIASDAWMALVEKSGVAIPELVRRWMRLRELVPLQMIAENILSQEQEKELRELIWSDLP